jgi:nucleotide-binding universal stress UspA family protein
MQPVDTIVIAVDLSATSADTIGAALETARGRPHRLHLLHVVTDVFRTYGTVEAPAVDWTHVQRDLVEQARGEMMKLAAACALDPLHVTIAVEAGDPTTEILRYAEAHQASLLVLGSHGHGIIRRFMLGSVAERVMRLARCPVLLVPHRLLRLTSFEVKAASGVES